MNDPHRPVADFSPGVRVVFSDVTDGSIAAGGGRHDQGEHVKAARRFVRRYFGTEVFTKVFVGYGEAHSYTDVLRVTSKNEGYSLPADALFTTESSLVITLPVADCLATVVYDPTVPMLGVLHLGRHASVAGLIEIFAECVSKAVSSHPANWQVWMSPGLRVASDRLDYFLPEKPEQWQAWQHRGQDGKVHIDIPGHNRERFMTLGVQAAKIYASDVDTYTDTRYFSHRAAIEQANPEKQGRMMVAAMLEP